MPQHPLVRPYNSGWRFTLAEPDLSFIRIDHQARLQFGPTEVVIETAFDLVANGVTYKLDPADRPTLGPFIGLYPDAVAEATADAGRALRLTFASGTRITVPHHPQHEAWRIVGPGTPRRLHAEC